MSKQKVNLDSFLGTKDPNEQLKIVRSLTQQTVTIVIQHDPRYGSTNVVGLPAMPISVVLNLLDVAKEEVMKKQIRDENATMAAQEAARLEMEKLAEAEKVGKPKASPNKPGTTASGKKVKNVPIPSPRN